MRICARVRLIFLGKDSSDLLIGGGLSLRTLFGSLSFRCFCTIAVWMILRFCLIFSGVIVFGSVCMVVVYVLFG